MKSSWVMAIVMLYLVIFACEMFATGGTVFGAVTSSGMHNVATENQSTLIIPQLTNSGNVITQAWTIITNVGTYLATFIGILFLWAPTVWSGYMAWVYWFICFPVSCMMVFAIVSLARGVHSA